MRRYLFIIGLCLAMLTSCRQDLTVSSPDGSIKVALSVEGGRLGYSVSVDSSAFILNSPLGLEAERFNLAGDFAVVGIRKCSHDESWTMPWGENKDIRDSHNELEATFKNKDDVSVTVRVRAFDDGIGFRYEYEVPADSVKITDEKTGFRFAQDGTSWSIPANFGTYELLYRTMPVSEVDNANTPFTVKTSEGLYASIHEAALYDYPEMTLVKDGDLSFKADLAPWPDGLKAREAGKFKTPWRVILIGRKAVDLVNSNLILNLNEPCAIEDVSWIKPMKYVGVWWGMHLGVESWYDDGRHGATTANALKYIDFAAANNIDGVLFEGWNSGWDTWGSALKNEFDFTSPAADFDFEKVTSYAREKGVSYILHHETGGKIANYERQLDTALDWASAHGIHALKTGYAGSVPGGHGHHGQYMVRHYQKVLEAAAARQIMVDAHEPIKATGIRRTWPNFMCREGARGMEWNAWSAGNPPEHQTILPFTRLLGGPMDYTPGVFDIEYRSIRKNPMLKAWNGRPATKCRCHTTLAKQIADWVVLYSPMQMACDLIENYKGHPAFQFFRDFNADCDWSEALQGEVGDYIVVARRAGDTFFLGAVADENARRLEQPLSFLPEGIKYEATIYADGPKASFEKNPYSYEILHRTLTAKDTLAMSLATSGGCAVVFKPIVDWTVPEMKDIPAGSFTMGSAGEGYDFDEAPLHEVSVSAFRMSACEITNAQFEEFCPQHKALRGSEFELSTGDNEAAVYVSWHDADAYCRWLSGRTGRHFRLPTEAEWEYACRAGTLTPYSSGDALPEGSARNQQTERNLKTVSLEVGKSQPNQWGLYDMHGNVEEWCFDYYGLYGPAAQSDPSGPSEGEFMVTRGGSHNTPAEFLRSANRSAALPEDAYSQIGFRIVESDIILEHSQQKPSQKTSKDKKYKWAKPSEEPLFAEPQPYVLPPVDGTPFYHHNHQPAVTWCDNGDLLAIWFSCDAESGREMVVLGSRFSKGKWSPATLFYKVPDRNMTGSSLIRLQDGELLHINGVGNSGDWQNLALTVRCSRDNGKTWSRGRQVSGHAKRHQVIAGGILLDDGTIVQPCDAGPEGHDGTALMLSRDGGHSWLDAAEGLSADAIQGMTEIAAGLTSPVIAGIHAGVVELNDGSLLALGRGNAVRGADGKLHMPMSISRDNGRSWRITPSPFPTIDGGQRLVLRRLNEGPLMLVSFTDHQERSAEKGLDFEDGKGYGVFVALSYDEGRTWPVRKLLSDGRSRPLDGGAWTGEFEMDAHHAEPKGYFAATQTPDGIIHILSSRLHYRINLPWILAPHGGKSLYLHPLKESVQKENINISDNMIKINLKGCSSFVSDELYKTYVNKALKAFDVLDGEQGAGNDFLGWKHLPSETPESLIGEFEAIRDDWKAKGVNLVIVIGIGGSYLGARCAIEALSRNFNQLRKGPKTAPDVVFAGNNLSEEYLADLMDLAAERNTACIVISKSGTTTEPAVAFRIVKAFIEKNYKDASERIVAITDAKKGALKTLSTQEGYRTFIVPDNVGGRFSVLTPVGLLPILVAGFDIRAMLEGAAEMEKALAVRSEENVAVKYAAIRNLLYSELGKKVEIMVTYNPKLQYLGEWWKQLYGESEGKDGKGIFPASVNNTADLHSMGQFIQEGERVMFETVINVENALRSVVIGSDEQNLDQLNFLAGKHVEYCGSMARLGTVLAHIDGGVPQIEISMKQIDEKSLGEVFYFFEFACGVSAYLLGVNPFNQPGVEAYKKNMFALLEKPGYEAQTQALRERL